LQHRSELLLHTAHALRGTELTTAKALRLKIPEPFLLRVDEAIE
jgi:hypothetical protein